MNPPELKFADFVLENNEKCVVEGVEICCECGSTETTVLTFGMYCRICRNFGLYKNKVKKEYHYLPGTTLDLD